MFAFDYISVSGYYTKRCLVTIELISGLWGHNNIELLPFSVRVYFCVATIQYSRCVMT
jgi:hypothetical protein